MTKSSKKSLKKSQVVNLYATFSVNNTIITASNMSGEKLFQVSPSCLGYKGPKKPTPYAAQAAMIEVVKRLQDNHKTTSIENIFVSGPGPGRDVALRSIKMPVTKITDITPIVYNGTRPKGAKSL